MAETRSVASLSGGAPCPAVAAAAAGKKTTKRAFDDQETDTLAPVEDRRYLDKKLKSNCWEAADVEWLEEMREEDRARSIRMQAMRSMQAKLFREADECLRQLAAKAALRHKHQLYL